MPNNCPSVFCLYFIWSYCNYFFFLFYILFLPGPYPWNVAHKYLKAYLGFINWPFAFLYSNLTLSLGSFILAKLLSVVLPTAYSFPINEFSLKNWRAPANPVPTTLSSKKLTYCLIFYSYSGLISLKDYGNAYFSYFLTNLYEGSLINIADVVPDLIPPISIYFLTYFLS
jgi:hypothetical protein